MDINKVLSTTNFEVIDGIISFDCSQNKSKLNRLNVLEELGKGIIWKNIYAHYYRFLFILRWLRPNTILVDVGCGRGWLMDLIYRNRMRVSYIGIDLSLNSLKYAIRKPYQYPHFLIRADCCEKPLTGAFADYVVCLETIEHNDKERGELIIQWCKSILKPGGSSFYFNAKPKR